MSYRQRPEAGEYGTWLVPHSELTGQPYEGADAVRAHRLNQNRRNGVLRPMPDAASWDALHVLCEKVPHAGGIADAPPLPWHRDAESATAANAVLRAWDRWQDVCEWAVRHGLVDLLPPRIDKMQPTATSLPRPIPSVLNDIYKAMREWADEHTCEPHEPPKPLILSAYWHSTEREKERRWQEMIAWAERNGCAHVLDVVSDATADDPMIRQHGRDWQHQAPPPQTSREDFR